MKRKNKIAFLIALFCGIAIGQSARTVRLTEKDMAKIHLQVGRTTVLSFPVKPTKVILGNQGAFAIEYVENDLAIAPLHPRGRTNLFVYLEGRRFSFDLESSDKKADEIVLIRDAIPVKKR